MDIGRVEGFNCRQALLNLDTKNGFNNHIPLRHNAKHSANTPRA